MAWWEEEKRNKSTSNKRQLRLSAAVIAIHSSELISPPAQGKIGLDSFNSRAQRSTCASITGRKWSKSQNIL